MNHVTISSLAVLIFTIGCGGSSTKPEPTATVPEEIAQASHSLRIDNAIVVPTKYQATLKLDPSKPTFTGTVKIDVNVTTRANEFYLNGYGLDVASAQLTAGDQTWELNVSPEEKHWLLFRSSDVLKTGPATLTIQYAGKIDDKSSFGIFRQESVGDWYLFTQFEARGARRAFPSFDQPDLKVPWRLSLDVPEGLVALTNTPEVSRKPSSPGHVLVEFAESQPLPSYLVAFAVGPFDMVDIGKTRNGVNVRVATPKGRGGETEWVVKSTLRLIEILEDYTGIPYPYAKLDLVSIPATGSFGAMENAGLITYTETLLLSKDNSLSFREAYASVGAHELAHQWFGNLVTNAWWDDLWLNESFATWAAAKTLAEFEPKWRADVSWLSRRATAMHADRLASARVIHQPIKVEGDIGAAFDRITYAKGASILTMFEGWLGTEAFQRGIQHYLKSNSWKAATAAVFLQAMDVGTGTKLSESFATFIDNPGTPLLHFSLVCNDQEPPMLRVKQERYLPLGSEADASQAYKIPVCVRYPTAQGSTRQCTAVHATEQTFFLDALKEPGACPAWVMPNDGATGYYYSELSEGLLTTLLQKGTLTAPEEMGLARDLKALVDSGRIPVKTLVDFVGRLARSKDDGVVAAAAKLAKLGRLVDAADQPRYEKWLRKTFGKRASRLGWKAKKNELPAVKALREALLELLIFEANDGKLRKAGEALANKWFADPKSVDPDVAQLALRVGARWSSESFLYDYISGIKATSDRSRRRLLLKALGSVVNHPKNPSAVAGALDVLLDAEIPVRESASSLLRGISGQIETSEETFAFVVKHFDTLRTRFGTEMEVRLSRVVGAQCGAAQKAAVESFLSDKIAPMDGGKNAAKQALEQYQLCVASLQRTRF